MSGTRTKPLLDVQGITVRFGGVTALDGLGLQVKSGSVHGLIGPNGAGKTTAFNVISGLTQPVSGSICLDGVEIGNKPSYSRTGLGLARTFQNIRLFKEMTVLENVMTGQHSRTSKPLPSIVFRTPRFRDGESKVFGNARNLLELVGLHASARRLAGELPYGDQRRLEIARALAADPKIVLLDEPAAGLNPTETHALADLLKVLKSRGYTLLLVEHDMHFIMNLCDRITVLNFGRKIAEGSPLEVRSNPLVVEAYLGAKVAQSLAKAGA